MKKLLMIMIFIFSISSIAMSADGIFPDNLNFTLNNSSRVEIKIVGAAQSGSSFLFHTKGGEDFEVYKTSTSTEPFTFKDGESGSVGFWRDYQDITFFWAILVSASTDVLEVFVYKQ